MAVRVVVGSRRSACFVVAVAEPLLILAQDGGRPTR